MIYLIILSFIAVFFVLHLLMKRKYSYWKSKNVPHLKPVPIFGNFGDHMKMKINMAQLEQQICQQFLDEPLIGVYFGTEPCLIVQDPKYVKIVTTKDFYYFSNREVGDYSHKERLSNNLFSSSGDTWRVLRQNLTPTFTSTKMKNMFHLIVECSKTFERLLDNEVQNKVVEVRSLVARFTLDCIGSCAFGLNLRAMENSDPTNPFLRIGKLIFKPTFNTHFKTITRLAWPTLFYFLRFNLFPPEVANFFIKLLIGVFKERLGQKSTRNDFIDLMMSIYEEKHITGDSMRSLKNNKKESIELIADDELLSAQCFAFFAGGYETSATTSSLILFELAKHPEIQERVRVEIDEYLQNYNGVLGYECVTELPFLEQCVNETLRLYPVIGVITREVIEPYTFADTKLTVEKNMRIHLPVYHIHRNPKYWSNPDEYNPERFSPEAKKNIVPYTYFPFGEGPRICIGMRFAKMQMFAGLVTVLKKYRVELAPGMPTKIEYEPKAVVTQSKHGIHLKLIPRTDRVVVMYD